MKTKITGSGFGIFIRNGLPVHQMKAGRKRDLTGKLHGKDEIVVILFSLFDISATGKFGCACGQTVVSYDQKQDLAIFIGVEQSTAMCLGIGQYFGK